jgi:Zn-dependent metalloprotease
MLSLALFLPALATAAPPNALQVAEEHLAAAALERSADHRPAFEARRALDWAAGTRVRVTQKLAGLPVEGGEMVVALGRDGAVRRTYGRMLRAVPPDPDPHLDAAAAEDLAQHTVQLLGEGRLWPARSELVAFVDRAGAAHLAWAVDASLATPPSTWRVLVDAHTGALLHTTPTSRNADANVYPANPLNSEVTRVTLQGLTDTETLTGSYAEVWSCDASDVDDSLFGLSTCHQLGRHATPDDDGHYLFEPDAGSMDDPFAEAHLYYHLDLVSDWFSETYGFAHGGPMRGIVNFEMSNAFFGDFDGDGFADVSFGQAPNGVDFGYDADVIYHEYGHSVVDGTSTLGFLRADEYGLMWDGGALNEGTADVFSLVLTGDPLTGEYAGSAFGEVAIRDLTEPRRCPDDLYGEAHYDGEIWGALAWQLMEDPLVGPELTGDLVYGALTTWTLETDWTAAGVSLLDAAADMLADELITAEANDAIVGHLESFNLLDCGRVVQLDDGTERAILLIEGGLPGDFEHMPGGVQFSLDVPENAEGLRFEVTDFTSAEMGWMLYVREGSPVGHRVNDLAILGVQIAIPETYDLLVEGEGSGYTLDLTADSELPLVPGETYYFSFAGRNLGGIEPFEFTFSRINVRGEVLLPEEKAGGCACAAPSGAAPWWLLVAPGLLLAYRRRRGV